MEQETTETKQEMQEKTENQREKGLYTETIKAARNLYRSLGIPLFLYLILYNALRDYILVPLMGKVWGLCLTATPDGFISTSNFIAAFLSCPWILLVGAALVVLYALLALWQATAIIIGIGYMHQGHRIRIRDLFTVSLRQLKGRVRKENWPILIYVLIIVPLTNIYQTNDLISRFIIPEYIQDFIDNNTFLSILCGIVGLGLLYLALRLFFLLPSFILKKESSKEASQESFALTRQHTLANGINIALYNFIELLRLSLLPMLLILLPVSLCYVLTRGLEFSSSLYGILGVTLGVEAVESITGTLVQVSTLCFLVELYYRRLQEYKLEAPEELPELREDFKGRLSMPVLQFLMSACFSLLVAAVYLIAVNNAQEDTSIIYELFGNTEVIAHKGYSTKAPENTMPAFEKADKCEQVSYIELDVWSSKEGIPVVIHNSSIKEATGIDKEIYECTVDELKDLPAPYHMKAKDFPEARIPTLEEVIAEYAGSTPLLIEIKGFKQDPELPAKIVALMKKYGCEYTSLIHSGNYGALEAVKQIDPDIKCGLILAMVTGNYYDLPYADFYSIEHSFISHNTVSQLHRRNKKVFAWTVNYEESAEDLRFTGVDGLITDVPEEINHYVADTNQLVKKAFTLDLSRWLDFETAGQAFENGEY